jgi:hypothetical protein
MRCNEDTTEPTSAHLLSFVFTTSSLSSSTRVAQMNKYGDCKKYLPLSAAASHDRSANLLWRVSLLLHSQLDNWRWVERFAGWSQVSLAMRRSGNVTFLLAVDGDQSLCWLLADHKTDVLSADGQH